MNKLPQVRWENICSLLASIKGGGRESQKDFFIELQAKQPGIWDLVCAILTMYNDGIYTYDFAEGMLKGIAVTLQALERQIEVDELNQQWGLEPQQES